MAKRPPKNTGKLEPDEDFRLRVRKGTVRNSVIAIVLGVLSITGGASGASYLTTKSAVEESAPDVKALTQAVVDLKTEVIKTNASLGGLIDVQGRDRKEFDRRITAVEDLIKAVETKSAEQKDYERLEARVKALEDRK